MLVIIGRDDRNVQQQEEEEESGSSSSSSSSGEESDSEDGLPFSMSRAGYVVLIFGLLVAGIGVLLVWLFWRRQFRIQGSRQRRKPAFILKTQQLWCKWVPCARNKGYRFCGLQQQQGQGHARHSDGLMMESEMQEHPMTTDPAVGIARATSERSVLTLPAYTSSARPTERIIGREGERGGVDVVVEYPQTAEEEESQRQRDMTSLHNIRLTRRAEQIARAEEEGRLQRRRHSGTLAHSRSSSNGMLDISAAAINAADRNSTGNETMSSETLLANHQADVANRERRTSSVAYSYVGVARHDGTRIHSTYGDAGSSVVIDVTGDGRSIADMPLLGSAASIGGAGGRSSSSRPISDVSTASMFSRGSTSGQGNLVPGITTPGSGSGSGSGSTQRSSSRVRTSSNGSASANGAATTTILTPPAFSDDSLDDNSNGVVITPPEDHPSNSPPLPPPPQYDAPPPTYEGPPPRAQQS